MAATKGHPKAGGRQKGTPNKVSAAVQDVLARLGCDPIEGLAQISLRRVSCGTCVDENGLPTGVTRFILPDTRHANGCKAPKGADHGSEQCSCNGIAERVCLSCFGTLRERIGADLKFKADSELAQYVAAKRKAVEISGPEGTTLPITVNVVYRKPEELSSEIRTVQPVDDLGGQVLG